MPLDLIIGRSMTFKEFTRLKDGYRDFWICPRQLIDFVACTANVIEAIYV